MNTTTAMPRLLRCALITTGLLLVQMPPALAADQSAEVEAPQGEPLSTLPLEDLQVFTKAYDHIRKAYVKELDDRTLLEYAIRGMVEQLDPHSSYLDEDDFADIQVSTTGEFGGLGIEVGMEDGFVKVISPIDDTPAARGGIEAGDLIIKLDGTTVKGMSLGQAVDKMRGPRGSKITLTVVRKGNNQPFDITLTRDVVKVTSVRAELMDEAYAYLRIAQFQVNTGKDLLKNYTKLEKQNPNLKGVILDLRNNPGGVLQASVEVVDLFLDGGLVVYTEGRLDDSNVKFNATPGDVSKGLPMVVLINDGSASASEIVAGALQDQGRALVVGTHSFGKGSVQTIIPIVETAKGTRGIKLTTALYFTPSGRSIQAQGIEPDIAVERVHVTAVRQSGNISEASLSGHLANGSGDQAKHDEDDSDPTELQDSDSQLYEALTLLKGLDLFIARGRSKQPVPAAANSAGQ